MIGCANGVVRVFDPVTLQYIATLPRPHALGKENGPSKEAHKKGGKKDKEEAPFPPLSPEQAPNPHPRCDTQELYPDAVAVRSMWDDKAVAAVYSDHSLYIWDITAPKKPIKLRSFLSHTGCIWDMDVVPPAPKEGGVAAFPEGTIVTCGADGTVRAWNFEEENLRASASSLQGA